MATAPRVLLRNMTAMKRAKGLYCKDSWTRPKVGEERGGKGMHETGSDLGCF